MNLCVIVCVNISTTQHYSIFYILIWKGNKLKNTYKFSLSDWEELLKNMLKKKTAMMEFILQRRINLDSFSFLLFFLLLWHFVQLWTFVPFFQQLMIDKTGQIDHQRSSSNSAYWEEYLLLRVWCVKAAKWRWFRLKPLKLIHSLAER